MHTILQTLKQKTTGRLKWLLNWGRFCLRIVIFIFIHKKKTRLLGIWDYKALPMSLGDPMLFIEKLNTLRHIYNVQEIDMCVIYDKENPGGNRKDKKTTVENAQDVMLDYLPLFSTCPYLGSIFQFNSRKEFYLFLKNNLERYITYPPLFEHFSEKCNFAYPTGENIYREIQQFHTTYGFIPHLRIGTREDAWAKWFYANVLPKNKIPVSLTMRQPTDPKAEVRNADPAIWLPFIKKCSTAFPEVVFIHVGSREEVIDDFKKMENVIITKTYGTTMMEDIALIKNSFLYIGTVSGINVVAIFSELPYLIYQVPDMDLLKIENGRNHCFATPYQKMFDVNPPITTAKLLEEFSALYAQLTKKGYNQ